MLLLFSISNHYCSSIVIFADNVVVKSSNYDIGTDAFPKVDHLVLAEVNMTKNVISILLYHFCLDLKISSVMEFGKLYKKANSEVIFYTVM